MNDSKHILLRQTLELHATGPDAREQADVLARFCREKWPHLLENALNRFDDPDTVIRLDKVDITINIQPGEDLEKALENHLKNELPIALERAMSTAPEAQTKANVALQWLLHLLEKGYLPWSVPSGLSLAELEYLVSEGLPGNKAMLEKLLRILQQPRALRRLIAQFSEAMPKRIAEAIQRFDNMQVAFEAAFSNVPIKPEAAFAFWQTYFADRQLFFAQQENTKIESITEKNIIPEKQIQDNKHRGEEGIFINNAGLILLYPYLSAFFTKLGCIENKNEISLPTKSLFALHLACTGKDEAAEWELVLPKILCGIDLDAPVETHFNFSMDDKNEINDLLVSIIKNWPALKNSSPNALRETFLQRDGKLMWHNNQWRLQVAANSVDVLLDKLPWGIGFIKLPWMPHPIMTEWT